MKTEKGEIYGINFTGDNSENLANITTDYLFGCANRFVASHAASDLYAYQFNENSINVWPDVVNCDGKACHGDDLLFTFHADVQLGIHFSVGEYLRDRGWFYEITSKRTVQNGAGRQIEP